MTKKDFKALVKALRFSCPLEGQNSLDYYQWETDCRAVANACQASNANFDCDRFIHACEGREKS